MEINQKLMQQIEHAENYVKSIEEQNESLKQYIITLQNVIKNRNEYIASLEKENNIQSTLLKFLDKKY